MATDSPLSQYPALADRLQARGIDVEAVKTALKNQHIETPSWGYANSGTRFKTFAWPGAARSIYEKVDDAAFIHKMTGVAPSMAIHIPWDKTDDWDALAQYAAERDIQIGAVNPNVFQDDAYKLGSLGHPSGSVQEQAIAHMVECCEIMAKTKSSLLSLWFADGTNYAGQDDFRERKHRFEHGLRAVYGHLPPGARMLIEYKFFEPAFYSTDLPDWGTAYAMALKLGDQAQVLVDTGHHPQGTNIEMIVAFLLDEGRLGGFHFNARKYADDDLIVGSSNPFELFLIFKELTDAGERAKDVAYMLDQNHNIEAKLEGIAHSIHNCQVAYAKALVIDRKTLRQFQLAGDVMGAHRVLMDAYESDVRPLIAKVREELGRPLDPVEAIRTSAYPKQIAEKRGKAETGTGGFQ
jgi:L-rhamnose isomerase/sugar isomerase